MTSSTITTFAHLAHWINGAMDRFGDPSIPVCQLFFQWAGFPADHRGELTCGMLDDRFALWLDPESPIFLPVAAEAEFDGPEESPSIVSFGADRIAYGIYALSPSLNIPGQLHGFVTLIGVPEPAPWLKPRIEIFRTIGGAA